MAMEAPFIYHGNDPVPDLGPNVAVLKLENTRLIQLEPVVLPPARTKKAETKAPAPTVAKKESHGFFAK